ncbi:unnamed protein product, partial [marine sediment metagenome]
TLRAAKWLTHVKLNGGVLSNCFVTGPKQTWRHLE